MKILLIFENFYDGYGDDRLPLVYDTSIINRANATYSRVIPYLEPIATRLGLSETSSVVARDRTDKPPVDFDHVRGACNCDAWDHIVSFGRKADTVLTALQIDHHALPHPVSFQWRRATIEALVAKLLVA